ncbi:MAG: sensor histidine kinase, partial [Alphaproteobacteria bacterium]|nr:sensor histidine kinase [Alphaproteobacteria bacterium]
SPEGIARAFEPFGSDGNPLTRNREGVGLGLPISRKIIEQHGGTIQITSIPDVGTEVVVCLPPASTARDVLADAAFDLRLPNR